MASTFATTAQRWNGRLQRLLSGRADVWWYALRSRLRGLDLSQVPLEQLGLSPDRSVFHDNSGGPDLKRVLKQLPIPKGSVALDYGSGKGGAVITLSEFPFIEVVGVEISRELLEVAEANLRRAHTDKARLVNCDASAFTDLDRVTHIYMYHPFRGEVLKAVLANVRASLSRCPRHLTLIYKNPVHHDAIIDSGAFRLERETNVGRADRWGLFKIYVHDEQTAA